MMSFKILKKDLKALLESAKCKGHNKAGKESDLINDCVIEVSDKIEIRALGRSQAVYIDVIYHDAEDLVKGEIPMKRIQGDKTSKNMGLLDAISIFSPTEKVTVSYKDGIISVKGNKHEWNFETVKVDKIMSRDKLDMFEDKIAQWDNKNKRPIVKGIPIVNSGIVKGEELVKIASIIEKIGVFTKKMFLSVVINKEGIYMKGGTTEGVKLNSASYISKTVELENDEIELKGIYKHGPGNIMNHLGGLCKIFFIKGSANKVHMWIREESKKFTKNYFIPGAK